MAMLDRCATLGLLLVMFSWISASAAESEDCDTRQAEASGNACLLDFQRDTHGFTRSAGGRSDPKGICCPYKELKKCLQSAILEAGCENRSLVEKSKMEADKSLETTGNTNCSNFDTALCAPAKDNCNLFEFDTREMNCRIKFSNEFPLIFLSQSDEERACCAFKNVTICIQRALAVSSCNHDMAIPVIQESRRRLNLHDITCRLEEADPCKVPGQSTSSTQVLVASTQSTTTEMATARMEHTTTPTLSNTTAVTSSLAVTETTTHTRQPRELSDEAATTEVTDNTTAITSTTEASTSSVMDTSIVTETTLSTTTPADSGAVSISMWIPLLVAVLTLPVMVWP